MIRKYINGYVLVSYADDVLKLGVVGGYILDRSPVHHWDTETNKHSHSHRDRLELN